jgi:hypothetical protein
MISSRELKDDIEQLSEQNQYLTSELRSIKEMLAKQVATPNKQAGTDDPSSDEKTDGNQNKDKQDNQGQDQSKQNSDISAIATDFSKLKDLTAQLEVKMQSYLSDTSSSKGNGNSNGDSSTLSNEDAINLILAIMNGMIDWTMDMMAKPGNNEKNSNSA